MRVAIIGTGIMGAGMARALRRNGHDVVVWNRTRGRAEALAEDGIVVADSVSDAVGEVDAALTILFDTDATLEITDELAGALPPDSVWIQAGTVGTDGIAQILRRAARDILDAPVLGTKKPAEDGTLTVLVSGEPGLVDKARPVFDVIGSRTIEVSDRVGDASALKLVCNAWIGLITAGTAQSVAFAERLGLDPTLFLRAIEGAPVDSLYAQLKGKAILSGNYAPSFAVDGVVKDIGLMLDAADDAGFPSELLSTVRELFRRASAAGHGDEDMAAVRFAFPSR